MLTESLKEILDITMKYVDEADKHNVDKVKIEQELQDIEDKIETLALEIETGGYEL